MPRKHEPQLPISWQEYKKAKYLVTNFEASRRKLIEYRRNAIMHVTIESYKQDDRETHMRKYIWFERSRLAVAQQQYKDDPKNKQLLEHIKAVQENLLDKRWDYQKEYGRNYERMKKIDNLLKNM